MTPTSSLAGHLEYLVSAPEDPGDRDKRLLDEWTRSIIHSLLLSCLVPHIQIVGTTPRGAVRAAPDLDAVIVSLANGCA